MTFRPLPVLTAATLSGLAILIGLGVWQAQRYVWKTGVIADLQAAATSESEPLPAFYSTLDLLPNLDPPAYCEPSGEAVIRRNAASLRKMRARGVLETERTAFVYVVDAEHGPGYLLISPLLVADAVWERVLVIRGFVTQGMREQFVAGAPEPRGPESIVGLVRTPESGLFGQARTGEAGIYTALDLCAIGRDMGLSSAAPAFLHALRDPSQPAAWPRGVDPLAMIDRLPNRHLEYSLTWFAFAVTLLVVYIAMHVKSGRLILGRKRIDPD